jgi:DNA-binding MarR family transcriptional regulator
MYRAASCNVSQYDVVVSKNHEPDGDDYRRLLDLRTGLRQFLRWSEQQAKAVGITPAQHQLLLTVRGHPDPEGPTIGDVADALLLRHHSAVGLVDRAVEAGLVDRYTDAIDHRWVRLRLTPLGARRLRQLSGAHLEELRRLAPVMRSLWANLDRAPPER